MLAIKLKMVGKRNQRSFRVIVQEARSKLRGKFVEDLGWYNPHTNQFKLNKERIDYWIGQGAQPTARIQRILQKSSAEGGTESYKVREGRKKKKKERVKVDESAKPDKASTGGGSASSGKAAELKAESVAQEDGLPETSEENPGEEAILPEKKEVEKSGEESLPAERQEPATKPEESNAEAEAAEGNLPNSSDKEFREGEKK